ncbi:MAG: alpha/beta hydrolase [Williamsia sp.]|nr:alpha/beta hydrolase [Williamsia sp.]
MRIILIPGLGEDEFIFDKIIAELPGDKLVLSLWKLLPDRHVADLNVVQFARELVARYKITDKDVMIGHSAGGWVAVYIRQITGCPVVQVSSWTDSRKVIVPVRNRHLIYFTARTGLYLNRLVLWWSVKKYYKDKPSLPVFRKVFNRLVTGNRANAVNQLRLIFNPRPERLEAEPNLRIHAIQDAVIRFPDGEVQEVPGDHFSIYTYPETVIDPIRKFLTDLYAHA